MFRKATLVTGQSKKCMITAVRELPWLYQDTVLQRGNENLAHAEFHLKIFEFSVNLHSSKVNIMVTNLAAYAAMQFAINGESVPSRAERTVSSGSKNAKRLPAYNKNKSTR